MIIDSHTHLSNALAGSVKKSPQELYQALKADMQEAGIAHAVIIQEGDGIPGEFSFAELVSATARDAQITLVGSVNPLTATEEHWSMLEEALKEGACKGIKLYPGYEHFYPSDQRCENVYQLAGRYGVPVIIHTGDVFVTHGTELVKYAHPLDVDEVATKHPNVNIIMAHFGNPWLTDAAEVLYKNRNVYADVSGLILGATKEPSYGFVTRQFKEALQYAGTDRLLFGTDWPLNTHAGYLAFIKELEVPSSDSEKFLYQNAATLFKIAI